MTYIGHLFGHEGENSLMSWLKYHGYAHSTNTFEDHNLWGMTNFELSIQLTRKGVKNYDKVVEAVSHFTRVVDGTFPQEWLSNETRRIGQMTFDYADKEPAIDSVIDMASRMQIMDDKNMSLITKSKYVTPVHDPLNIKLVTTLMNIPQNLNIYLSSKSFERNKTMEWN